MMEKPTFNWTPIKGYTTTATASNNGIGEGRFQIEGLVVRDGDDPGKGYLARTLLLHRSM